MFYLKQFIFSGISTIGFSVLFNVPKKSIFYAGLTGGLGWTSYIFIKGVTISTPFSAFVGALVVGILGEIFARIYKKPVTTFVIPGIVPLVPGYGMYLCMVALINQDFNNAARIGTEAIFISGAISLGIIVVASVAKIIKSRRIRSKAL